MIDMHNHLVYGVDDGPSHAEASQKMLHLAAASGTSAIISTPHFFPGLKEFPMDTYREHLKELQEYCTASSLPLKLYSGAEIYYTDATSNYLQDGRIPTIAGSDCVLVEFSTKIEYSAIQKAVQNILVSGYDPVLAHIERYDCLRKKGRLEELKRSYPVGLQMNASTVVKADHALFSRWVFDWIESGLVDYVATDAHDPVSRPPVLDACAKVLQKRYGTGFCSRLLRENQEDMFGLD